MYEPRSLPSSDALLLPIPTGLSSVVDTPDVIRRPAMPAPHVSSHALRGLIQEFLKKRKPMRAMRLD